MHYEAYLDVIQSTVDVVVDRINGICIRGVELLIYIIHIHALHIGEEVYKCSLVHTQMQLVAVYTLENIEYHILERRHFFAHLHRHLIALYHDRSMEG